MKNIVQEARKQLHTYILDRIDRGYSVRKIAEEMGVTTQRVYQIKGAAEKSKNDAARRKAKAAKAKSTP